MMMNEKVFGEAQQPEAKENVFSCSTCFNSYKEGSLSSGCSQTKNNAVSCRECGRKPPRRISIGNRKKFRYRDLGLEKFTCDTCGKEFKRKENLIVHFRVHTGEKDYGCSVCGKKFAHKNTLKVHHRIHTGEKNYECKICGRKFAYTSTLKAHLKIHDIIRSELICNVCGKVFSHRASLIRHVKAHNGIRRPVYKKRLSSSTGNDTKLNSSTGNGTKLSSSTGNKTKLSSGTRKGDRNYICNICNKKFTLKATLKNHAIIHTGEKQFVCEYCGKQFRAKTHLIVHTTIHTGEKNHACDECGKRFSTKSHLRVHAKSHTGEKNYVCGECDKRFYIKSHLNHHIRMHTGEKYICDICGRKYNDKKYLKVHYQKHTQTEKSESETSGKTVKDLGKNVVMANTVECDKKLDNELILNASCDQDKTSISAFGATNSLNAEGPMEGLNSVTLDNKECLNSVVLDTKTIGEIPSLDINEAYSSCVVKIETVEPLGSCVVKQEIF